MLLWNYFCIPRKLGFFVKGFFRTSRFLVLVEENELPQKVQRKAFDEQSGASAEGGNIHINDRPGGKREKLPPGNQTEDYSRLGSGAFREGKNFWQWMNYLPPLLPIWADLKELLCE